MGSRDVNRGPERSFHGIYWVKTRLTVSRIYKNFVPASLLFTLNIITMPTYLQAIAPVNSSLEQRKITQMDPKLQQIVVCRQNGGTKRATSSTSEDEIAVMAKVTDPKAWFNLTEVRAGAYIGKSDDPQCSIVTGRIPIKRIEFIREQAFVKSLKAARKVTQALSATITETMAGPHLPAGMKATGGKGAIVGIVDFGCDFAHLNFLTANKKTRIKKIWDQSQDHVGTAVPYGKLFTEAAINSALTKPEPYNALGYSPGIASHGTHVMDIAAGNGIGSGMPGVAPEADIIFVELDGSDVPWDGVASVGKNFGDSVQLLEALKFIFDEAGDQPCVINASLGTNGGPHDGSTLVEQAIDSLVTEKPNRAVVIAASNSFADGIHAAGTVTPNATHDLVWLIPGGDITSNEMEIWYPGALRLEVEVLDPGGASVGTVPPDESGTVKDGNGNIVLFIANRLDDPNNHDNMIGIFLNNQLPGQWTVRLKNTQAENTPFHAWIERDDRGQSSFAPPHDNSFTLGSISCSHFAISVGSYDAHRTDVPLSWFSSSGPTRDNRQKPEVSAPGHDVNAAKSRSETGVVSKSGTSMASPAVAGSIAVMLAEAKSRNINLSIDEIRKQVISKARKNPPGEDWDPRYGFGRISVKDMVAGFVSGGSLNAAVTVATHGGKKKKAAVKKKKKIVG